MNSSNTKIRKKKERKKKILQCCSRTYSTTASVLVINPKHSIIWAQCLRIRKPL